jgi:chemotaxis protein CheX
MSAIKWSESETQITVTLPADSDLSIAAPLASMLQQALGLKKRLCLEASHVQRLSTACIQVLIAADFYAQEHECDYILVHPSPAAIAAMTDLGLAEWLDSRR